MIAPSFGSRPSSTLCPFLVLAALVLALASPARCDDSPAPKAAPVPVAVPVDAPKATPVAVPASSPGSAILPPMEFTADDAARVNASAHGLAGLKATDGAAPWEATAEWKDYQEQLNNQWEYLDRVRLSAMRNWGTTELTALRSQTSTIFYPFSGPDVLYADTLFPNSKVLIMAGLAPVGTMPDLAQLQQSGKLASYLAQVKTSLFTILAASFFKTKDMKNDFNNQAVDGLLPAMAVFIGRQNYTITSLQYVSLDHDGALHSRAATDKSGVTGVQINYGDGRAVLYFQADLGNDGLKSNPGFVKLMQKLAPGVTYLKAASYLLYEDYFSTIRDAILDDSVGVVEDDSGIPFKDFDPRKWNVTPYGNYTGPINLFKERNQPDLAAFYAKTPHQPLPFGSGYKFTAASSSLLVVQKK
jgi:hypothetical protein